MRISVSSLELSTIIGAWTALLELDKFCSIEYPSFGRASILSISTSLSELSILLRTSFFVISSAKIATRLLLTNSRPSCDLQRKSRLADARTCCDNNQLSGSKASVTSSSCSIPLSQPRISVGDSAIERISSMTPSKIEPADSKEEASLFCQVHF